MEETAVDETQQSDSNKSEEACENITLTEKEVFLNDIVDDFVHRVLDIEECAEEYITKATEKYNNDADRLKEEIHKYQKIIENEEDENCRLMAVRAIRKTLRDIDRHNSSSPAQTLEKSLFINLFAAFDKYVGDLLAVLYRQNPNLYNSINREVSLSEALQYESMEELRLAVLDKEIETIRRKSYMEQFKDLENRFSIKLRRFDEWPYFIERAQRRNLFTHCDGVVSQQYLDICHQVGCKFKDKKEVGEQLPIGSKYFFQSCLLVAQVAIMLGQTLWRKLIPEDLEKADSHLASLVFDYLSMERWGHAIALSKFALSLPQISTEEYERIYTVNYAIALKAINKESSAINVLKKKDWSATTYDFKLAYAVLTGAYDEAAELMKKIGKEGELITELSYHEWPLFREFRDREEFFCGYEEVYGYKYSTKLSALAEDKMDDVDEREE